MKKLNKFQINSERIMKNEELSTLRGGNSGEYMFWCYLEPAQYIGCVNTLTPYEVVGLISCRSCFGMTDYVLGPFDPEEGCSYPY